MNNHMLFEISLMPQRLLFQSLIMKEFLNIFSLDTRNTTAKFTLQLIFTYKRKSLYSSLVLIDNCFHLPY